MDQTFNIIGVDKASCEDVKLTIEALSEANAKVKAELKGVIVTSVEIADKATERPSCEADPEEVTVTSAEKADKTNKCPNCAADLTTVRVKGVNSRKKVCVSCNGKDGRCPNCEASLDDHTDTYCPTCQSSWGMNRPGFSGDSFRLSQAASSDSSSR